MELPHMGEHCSEMTCKQLDYLPMKCDACSQLFCKDHLLYDNHSCASKYKKDIQVPVCPLCNAPVPVSRGALPDLAVSAHIDQDCKQKTKEKVFTNKCNRAKCKKKELVRIVCESCNLNFCLTHRHPVDHSCQGPAAAARQAAQAASERAAAAAVARQSSCQNKITNYFTGPFRSSNPPSTAPARSRPVAARPVATAGGGHASAAASYQNGMSEDEALAAALSASMSDVPRRPNQSSLNQEDEDRMLALALQESEGEAGPQQPPEHKSCTVS